MVCLEGAALDESKTKGSPNSKRGTVNTIHIHYHRSERQSDVVRIVKSTEGNPSTRVTMKFRTDRIVLDHGAETTAQEPTANAGLVDVRLRDIR